MTAEKIDITSSIIEGIQDRKGKGITVINLETIETAPASKFIICEGNTPTQVSAIADSVRELVQENTGRKPYNYDGYRNSTWIVIDYGDIFVHIFVPETRKQYNLEELWYDAKSEQIPDID